MEDIPNSTLSPAIVPRTDYDTGIPLITGHYRLRSHKPDGPVHRPNNDKTISNTEKEEEKEEDNQSYRDTCHHI